MIKTKKLNQIGDTIVEVMLAMVILGAVLGGAYATAGRSSNTIRASQERGEALKLVEGQVEQLRALGSDAPDGEFCFRNNGSVNNNPPCTFGPDDRYELTIMDGSGGVFGGVYDQGTFIIEARWDRIGGGNESIDMVYKAITQ